MRDILKYSVDRAFLLKDKVGIERQLMAAVFELDTQGYRVKMHDRRFTRRSKQPIFSGSSPKKNAGNHSSVQSINTIRSDISSNKKGLQKIRQALAKINNELYEKINKTSERMYLENLECFNVL